MTPKPRRPLKCPDFYIACYPSGRIMQRTTSKTYVFTLSLARFELLDTKQLDYTPDQFFARGYTVRKIRMIEVKK